MGNRIISISRQFGSGGHEVAVKTADLLGIRVYERELIRLACEYGELSEKTLSPRTKRRPTPTSSRPCTRATTMCYAANQRAKCSSPCKATRSAASPATRSVCSWGAAQTMCCAAKT
ncbi:MAG: cytidylate kinase family protein [Oscillibacter sp.]